MSKLKLLAISLAIASMFMFIPIASGAYRAVVVGIADYPGSENDLNYADDDAVEFKSMLLSYPQFWQSNRIQTLINGQATRGNIINALTNMFTLGSAGDTFVFFQSSFGSRIYDQAPFDEADGYDETLVCYDLDLTDDQFSLLVLDYMPAGARLLVLIDACHSGGFGDQDKNTEIKIKGIDRIGDIDRTSLMDGDGFIDDLQSALTKRLGKDPGTIANTVTVSACKNTQESYEFGGLEHGAFSYYLLEAMSNLVADMPANGGNGNGEVSGEECYHYLKDRVADYVYNHAEAQQDPQLSDQYFGQLPLVGSEAQVTSTPTQTWTGTQPPTFTPTPTRTPTSPFTFTPTPTATTGQYTYLSWTGGDPDPGDTVTYTVYLEAEDDTPDNIVAKDVTETLIDPGHLMAETLYYWKVVALDNHGAVMEGDLWHFTTGKTVPTATPTPEVHPRPLILIAGFWDTRLDSSTGGYLDVMAYASSPKTGLINRVHLLYDGIDTGIHIPRYEGNLFWLQDMPINGDLAAQSISLQMEAEDNYASTSLYWPYLNVMQDKLSSSPTLLGQKTTESSSTTNQAPFKPANPNPRNGATDVYPNP